METPALRYDLNNSYGLDLPEAASMAALETILAARINAMILDDFSGLVQLLYRIDVNETGVRQLLKENPTSDGGKLIAWLILERVWQKILTRRKYSANTSNENDQPDPDEVEKW